MCKMLQHAHWDTKGGERSFAAICTSGRSADKAIKVTLSLNGCFIMMLKVSFDRNTFEV